MPYRSIFAILFAGIVLNPASAMNFNVGIDASLLEQSPIATLVASKLSDRQKLQKVLRPHSGPFLRITPGMRAAAGDRNMAVFDHRGGFDEIYRCSFITYRGKRAMVCD